MPSEVRFWLTETHDESDAVRASLIRRFPTEYAAFKAALEAVDPYDNVYPDNPGEYDSTIREAFVLGETLDGSLTDLDDDRLVAVLRAAASRDFGPEIRELEPDADRKMVDVVARFRQNLREA